MPRINPTSPIRSGFAYQDFWALKLCGEWLKDPLLYKWIQFETLPDEEDEGKFYLDDIVCLDAAGLYHFYQTKQRQDPDNEWTWNDFLKPSRKKGTSILNKWAVSLAPRFDNAKAAFFITNGKASSEISKYLTDEKLDIEQIKKDDPDLYLRISKEIGNEEIINKFFELLHLRFETEGLPGDELENKIRKAFYEDLNATSSGVTNLYLEIGKESRTKETRQLDIDTLRKLCEFDTPSPLDEEFNVPEDFEFFDNATHSSILADLKKADGGIKIIYGKPGVGKSVYLSKLDKELNEAGGISVKHHYHISPEDFNPQERLNTERVIEAVKSQLKTHRDELGDLANKNSKDIPLSEFISTIAKNLQEKAKSFVVIIDGLDHVLRYGSKEDLENFLKEVCCPQPGLWIVLGMQEIAKPHLPQIVLEQLPIEKWIEIKGLSLDATSKLIHANQAQLRLPDQAEQLKELCERLFEITSGNPLHLRYSLQQLKNLNGNSVVTEYSCRDLIAYGDDIKKYYDSLWNQISDNAKTLLLSIASVNFLFTEKQLIECVSLSTPNPADITNGFSQISHLISKNLRGQMNVFHNSFELFLKERPEMSQQKIVLKTNIKKWLDSSSYDYLKWAELRIIENDLGNSSPLLEIDRKWLIDAICYPCNPKQINFQMKTAAGVASEKQDFAKGLQITYLNTYYENSGSFVEEAMELIWKEALKGNKYVFEYLDLESIPSSMLPDLAERAGKNGNHKVVDEIVDILTERLGYQEYRQNTIPHATSAILKVIPHSQSHETKSIYDYIVQFRDLEISEALFRIYAAEVLSLEHLNKVEDLLKLDLTPSERHAILIPCTKFAFTKRDTDFAYLFEASADIPLISQVYLAFKGDFGGMPELPKHEIFVNKVSEHDSEQRSKWRSIYYENFLIGIIYSLSGRKTDIETWIDSANGMWSAEAMSTLFKASIEISKMITDEKVAYSALSDALSNLDVLKWSEDRDTLGFQFAFRDACKNIILDIIDFKKYLANLYIITKEEFSELTNKPSFFSKEDILSLILETNELLLEKESFLLIRDGIISKLSTTVNYFPDRAREYCEVSKLSRLYGDVVLSKSLLESAADNLLGYGYHKDTYIFDILEAVEFCAKSGTESSKIDAWIKKLIPIIENVGEYTDGDHTNHLSSYLGDLLAKVDKNLLYKDYKSAVNELRFWHSEDLFKSVLKSLSFSTDEQVAVAETSLEERNFTELEEIAKTNPGAQKALDNIKEYFGDIIYPKEKNTPYTPTPKPERDYSEVPCSKIIDYLSGSFESRWEWNEYLIGWLRYWIGQEKDENVFEISNKIINKFGAKSLFGEPLDLLYPLFYKFDTEIAFEFLCYAQDNDHGWSTHWTDKKKAEARWKFVKDHYSERYIHFFRQSAGSNVPLSRGVEYFILFGDRTNAEAITESSISFAESLMADTKLPVPNWATSEEILSDIDLLFLRLYLPNPATRERVATAIARLMCFSERKEEVFNSLLGLIKGQTMESMVAIALLPIIKAFYINQDKNLIGYIKIDPIVKSLPISSKVIEELVKIIAGLTEEAVPELPPYASVDELPADYEINPFFSKHIKTFLAPAYYDRATNIEMQTWEPFIEQWSYTCDRIIKEAGLDLDSNQAYYYASHAEDRFLLGFSSKVSEAFRSGFIRVLQHFHKNKLIPEDFYLEYIYATLPIDLSKWKISPGRSPAWWPKLDHSPEIKDDVLKPIVFSIKPESLIEKEDSKFIVGAEGAVQPPQGWGFEDPACSFLLVGFCYEVLGKNLPTPAEVSQKFLDSLSSLVVIPTQTKKPFNFLEDKENHIPIGDKPIQIKDLVIHPLVTRDRDLCIGLWQYYRNYNAAFNLVPDLSSDLKTVIDDHKWSFVDTSSKNISNAQDWLEGLKDRHYPKMPLPHGHFIEVDKDLLNNYLESKNLKLGYILKTTYNSKKYDHDKPVEHEDLKLLNI